MTNIILASMMLMMSLCHASGQAAAVFTRSSAPASSAPAKPETQVLQQSPTPVAQPPAPHSNHPNIDTLYAGIRFVCGSVEQTKNVEDGKLKIQTQVGILSIDEDNAGKILNGEKVTIGGLYKCKKAKTLDICYITIVR